MIIEIEIENRFEYMLLTEAIEGRMVTAIEFDDQHEHKLLKAMLEQIEHQYIDQDHL